MTPPHVLAALALLALIAALVGGRLARAVGLPGLTGYLAAGVLLGPSVLGWIADADARSLWLLGEIAIAFIALYAGLEMKVDVLRGRIGSILSIAFGATVAVFVLVLATKLVFGPALPVLGALSGTDLLLTAALIAAVCVTMSPMVTIAAIRERRASGPVTSTLLGTTVVVDLIAIVLFAALIAASSSAWGGGESALSAAAWKIGGSLFVGAVLGLALGAAGRYRASAMAAIGAAPLLVWSSAGLAATDLILTALTAGVVMANLPGEAAVRRLDRGVHRIATPFFATFFVLAGAKIDLGLFAAVWTVCLLLVVVRVGGLVTGAWMGATLAGSHGPVRRYVWLGFVSQAGISFAMASVVGQTVPGGAAIEAVLIGMIVLHEIVGPIATSAALRLSGEAGGRDAPVAVETS